MKIIIYLILIVFGLLSCKKDHPARAISLYETFEKDISLSDIEGNKFLEFIDVEFTMGDRSIIHDKLIIYFLPFNNQK